ncbi:hypothetical protein MCC02031_15280 [Bifidobacteriaceae bacterium MCC02031]|nr:hypothetical protein MCC02031_15280 [Bifidobacteriaceae bacterium MCC02031]
MPKGFSVALIDMLTFPSGPFPTSLDVGVVPYVMKGGKPWRVGMGFAKTGVAMCVDE